jgi:hypothetical protein
MTMKKVLLLLTALFGLLLGSSVSAQTFDQTHAEFGVLLKKHVSWQREGVTSAVDYAGVKKDRAALQAYTQKLAAVKQAEYAQWSRADQQAFLINAYNAYTLELIVESYPKLKSIKDLGSLISSPWSKARYPLLGKPRSLDNIEHDMLRGAKEFNEPRIHFAVNCASIGCPALRPEAFTGSKLSEQLEDQTKRFLKDRTRNRFDKKSQTLYLSSIFDWYEQDFQKGYLGAANLDAFLARYAGSLGLSNAEKQALLNGEIDIDFTDYDWRLNDKK